MVLKKKDFSHRKGFDFNNGYGVLLHILAVIIFGISAETSSTPAELNSDSKDRQEHKHLQETVGLSRHTFFMALVTTKF